MPHSLSALFVHLVFATKHREPWLSDRGLREDLHRYLGGICQQLDCPARAVGGVADHVHILLRLSKSSSIAEVAQGLKQQSSKWIKQQDPSLRSFYWQSGYGAFSVSPSHMRQLDHYIANQEAHHRTETFRAEMSRLARKYGLDLPSDHLPPAR